MISYTPSSINKTPQVNKNFSKIKYKQTNFICKGVDDYYLKRNKSKNNNFSKKNESNNIFPKNKKNSSKHSPKSINKKKTTARNINNNFTLNKLGFRCTSYDIDKTGINNNNNKKKGIFAYYKKIDNFNNIAKRNILKTLYINLNNDSTSLSKKFIFRTESNTNSNYNTGKNSNNNTLKKLNKNESNTVINHTTNKIKEKKREIFSQNINKYQKVIYKIERKKLSFDAINNYSKKNMSKDIFKKAVSKSNSQVNQNSLIIRFENKQTKNYFGDKKKEKEDSFNSEENVYHLISENEQGGDAGINSVKTNNFIINKPKEENLKYSSIKEFLDENEEQTEINPSQISKIIIGQIDGYKDIIDEDKNVNINDKSKSIIELLSKYSFSFIKNMQSIENVDNLNLFEDSNDIKKMKNCVNNNSGNIIGESNLPNITNIKNVEEDYDSEDLSISVFKNNIKSINTHSKEYLNKLFKDKSKNKLKAKNNNSKNKYYKNSINTNNTTISSGNNNFKDHNIKRKLNENNKSNNDKKSLYYKSGKKLSSSSSTGYNLHYLQKRKNSNSKEKKNNDKNEKKELNSKNIKKLKIIKNTEATKRLNTIKSTSNINNKHLDTNFIFKTNKKKNKENIRNGDELITPLSKRSLDVNGKKEELNHIYNKKIQDSNNIPILKYNEEKETIINNYFNNNEKEKEDKNVNILYDYNNINDKNAKQCLIF